MQDKIILKATDIVESGICTSAQDGERVALEVIKHLDKGYPIELSFLEVDLIISAFTNALMGILVKSYDRDFLSNKLSITDVDDSDQSLFKHSLDLALLWNKSETDDETEVDK